MLLCSLQGKIVLDQRFKCICESKSKHSCVFIRVRLNVCLHYYRQPFPFTLRIVSTKSLLFYCVFRTARGVLSMERLYGGRSFGRALLIRGVYQLMTFLCGPIQRCMWNRTKDHRLHVGFLWLLDNSANDLLQLFSRQCGRLSA